jgi:hypothetical protein
MTRLKLSTVDAVPSPLSLFVLLLFRPPDAPAVASAAASAFPRLHRRRHHGGEQHTVPPSAASPASSVPEWTPLSRAVVSSVSEKGRDAKRDRALTIFVDFL